VVAAARRAGARFSITARSSPAVSTAIASIRDDAWTPIHYPNAVWDEAEQRLISDAEIAEVPFTAPSARWPIPVRGTKALLPTPPQGVLPLARPAVRIGHSACRSTISGAC